MYGFAFLVREIRRYSTRCYTQFNNRRKKLGRVAAYLKIFRLHSVLVSRENTQHLPKALYKKISSEFRSQDTRHRIITNEYLSPITLIVHSTYYY